MTINFSKINTVITSDRFIKSLIIILLIIDSIFSITQLYFSIYFEELNPIGTIRVVVEFPLALYLLFSKKFNINNVIWIFMLLIGSFFFSYFMTNNYSIIFYFTFFYCCLAIIAKYRSKILFIISILIIMFHFIIQFNASLSYITGYNTFGNYYYFLLNAIEFNSLNELKIHSKDTEIIIPNNNWHKANTYYKDLGSVMDYQSFMNPYYGGLIIFINDKIKNNSSITDTKNITINQLIKESNNFKILNEVKSNDKIMITADGYNKFLHFKLFYLFIKNDNQITKLMCSAPIRNFDKLENDFTNIIHSLKYLKK